jgi:[ribosomal protein S5]-alanine N-acetyltransferase
MPLEFKRLTEVNSADLIALNNHPLVRRQMPLASGHFGAAECKAWLAGKEALWQKHGYGPWAFLLDGKFVGWGGLQYEDGDADLGLVLHPDHWGLGKAIYDEIIARAFGEMELKSVTILLPPSRKRIKGIFRLGFRFDGETSLNGERFLRYRLNAPSK